MDQNLAQEAINAALAGNWEKAAELNKIIVKLNPSDTDALNRLARAYSELGKISLARKTAQEVITIDPFNSIAQKSIQRWKGAVKGGANSTKLTTAQVFLEEPGKTKLVTLMHLGDSKTIAKLNAGDIVSLYTRGHRASVACSDGKHIGKLPDDLSARLRKFIALGYNYQAVVKSIDAKEVKIFIKEIKRPAEYSDNPSFTAEKIEYVSFTPPELVHKKDENTQLPETEEDSA